MKKKKDMELQELKILAQKVQLKLKPEETALLLDSFLELEKLLVNFHRLKLRTKNSYYRPKTVEINLKILRQLNRKYSPHLTKQKIFQRNALTSTKNFLLIPKKT